jgi:hypothetical protein
MKRRSWKKYFADNLQHVCTPLIDSVSTLDSVARESIGYAAGNASQLGAIRKLRQYAWTSIAATPPGLAPLRYVRKLSLSQREIQTTTLVRQSLLRSGKYWCHD